MVLLKFLLDECWMEVNRGYMSFVVGLPKYGCLVEELSMFEPICHCAPVDINST